MKFRVTLCTTVFSLLVATSSQAAFLSRLGGQAYYDDQLDITWATNTNLIGFGTWDSVAAGMSTLTIDGVAGWRLPDMDVNNDGTVVDCLLELSQAACKDNELGHINRYGEGTEGIYFGSPGPFTNMGPYGYWSSTLLPPNDAYYTSMSNGGFGPAYTENIFGGWAVHDGDVATVLETLLGDISGDGQVDIGDFTLWGDAFGDTGMGLPADLTMDNQVDIGDFTIWGDNFGNTAAPAGGGTNPNAVPEPSALVLLTVGLACLSFCTHRRRRVL